jgi:hypothetical protein
MKAIGFFANLHDGDRYNTWCTDHGATITAWGTINWDADQTPAKDGMSRINTNLFSIQKIASRMRREEFGDIFPENRVFADVLDIGKDAGKLQRVYDNMRDEIAMLNERSSEYKDHIFAAIIKARREAELIKAPTAVDLIEDMYDEGISPVIFANFEDTVQAIASRLSAKKKFKNKIGFLVGGQSDIDRENNIKNFQDDNLRIFIANIRAGNMGVSLHDLNGKYPRNSIIFPCWSAIDIIQAIGRIHRANGKTPCIQRFFYANVDIEIRMAERIASRVDNMDCLNDGDVMSEFVFVE